MGIYWIGSSISTFLLCWGAQIWTQLPRVVSRVLIRGEGSPPSTAGTTPHYAAQEAVDLCREGALLAHGQLSVHQNPHILLHQVAFQPVLVDGPGNTAS